MRARASRVDPAWLKAPLLLVRWPAILIALVAATTILGVTTAAAPLLLSSAGNAALKQELDQLTDAQAGLSLSTFGFVQRQSFAPADAQVKAAGKSLPQLGEPVVTVEGASTRVANVAGQETAVRFLHRTDAVDNIEKLTPDRGIAGVWISDTNAAEVGVEPGDELVLERQRQSRTMTVAGIYRNLASEPISEYWSPLTFHILSPIPNQPPLHPYLIMSSTTLMDVADGVGQQATFSWDLPLLLEDPTIPQAEKVADGYERVRLSAVDPLTTVGRALRDLTLFGSLDVHSSLPNALKNSNETVTAIEGPVLLISLAGRLVALAVIAAAGLFAHTRRRVEARLLSAQGRTPMWQACKTGVEVALPAAFGGLAGWMGGIALVRLAGPSERISPGVPMEALTEVAAWVAGAVILLAAVYGSATHQEALLGSSRIRQAIGRVPWEFVLLILAGASLYEVRTRGAAIVEATDKPAQIDLFLLAFPFLFVAAAAGLATRVMRGLLPRLREGGRNRSAWFYLALRRFAGAQKIGFLLITASAVALGVLVYSATLVATTSATVTAKAHILAGSDVAAAVQNIEDIPSGFRFPSTVVSLSAGDVFPGDERVNILAVDPATFEEGAFWDPSFADRPLGELLAGLATDGPRLPVILAGLAAPREATLEARAVNIPVEVMATVSAWPGMEPNRPSLIVDAATMSRIAQDLGSLASDPFAVDEMWVKGEPDAVFAAMSDARLLVEHSRTADEVQESPSLRSLTWTFGFLQALGLLAGLIAVVGLVLYLQSRQQAREVSYALARRMGLSRVSHRRAVAAELTAMLASSSLIGGTAALIAARLVAGEIDPLPGLPPGTLFRVPVPVLAVAPVLLVLVALLGAWSVQRRADRMNVAEVMRLAT